MLNEKLFASFPSLSSTHTLAELAVGLLRQQQTSWPQLTEGYAALKTVRLREVQCDGYSVFLQFNPQRIVSSGAKVDAQSIRERKCFLCLENLPVQQRGVLYHDTFLVLCNPAPILDRHYTIAHTQHKPQTIEGYVRTFLMLAKDLSPAFTVFYNGPKCGASAPDHMHFQAGPAGTIPVEKESTSESRRFFKKSVRGTSLFMVEGLGREVVVLEGNMVGEVESAIHQFIAAMKEVLGAAEEPMLNILCSYESGVWRLIVFPRRKHRPDMYFKEGDDRVLVSPASVDMGGLVVTPIEKDFNTIDSRMIQQIFAEVSLDRKTLDRIIAATG